MTAREWNAAILIAGQVAIVIWLMAGGPAFWGVDDSLAGTAIRLLWAVGLMIVWNIGVFILVGIVTGMAGDRTLHSPDDERDRWIDLRASRNAYVVTGTGVFASIVVFALGQPPVWGLYAVFAAVMLGALTESVSKLVYYRTN